MSAATGKPISAADVRNIRTQTDTANRAGRTEEELLEKVLRDMQKADSNVRFVVVTIRMFCFIFNWVIRKNQILQGRKNFAYCWGMLLLAIRLKQSDRSTCAQAILRRIPLCFP